MKEETEMLQRFVLNNPEALAYYAFKSVMEQLLHEHKDKGTKNVAIGVAPGTIVVLNTRSRRAYQEWELINPDGSLPTEKEIIDLTSLASIAKTNKVAIVNVVPVVR